MEETIYQRSEILLGKENIANIKQKHVVICGIGGVGSYALEALARIGIGKITIIDKDEVDVTNINRQIIAMQSTVGMDKVEVAKRRIHDINKDIEVISIKETITKDNFSSLINNNKIDYIVDSVDNIEAKVAIIEYCSSENIKCISCMGMGNKLNPLDIKVDDISKTTVCPLARIMRKRLKEIGIKRQKVVYSIENPIKKTEEEKICYGNTLGSVSFVPSCAGLVIASEIIKDMIIY